MSYDNPQISRRVGDTDPNSPASIASLPPDVAMMKLENDTIQSLAVSRPRDMEAIKAELETQMKAFPILAEKAVYRKPVGKDDGGKMKYAEGLSVRAAEAIAEVYGYNRVRIDIVPIDDTAVKVEATFTDYQRGRIWQDAGVVSKFYKSKSGGMARTPDDRFYGVVVKAEASRRAREVIMRSVSPGLKAWFEDACRKIAASKLDDNAVKLMVAKFGSIGVKPENIEAYLGKPLSVGLTQQDRLDLLGIWNAIEERETTIYEAFSIEPPKPTNPPGAGSNGQTLPNGAAAGPVNAGDFANAQGQTQDRKQASPAADTSTAPVNGHSQANGHGAEQPPHAQPPDALDGLIDALENCKTVADVMGVKQQFDKGLDDEQREQLIAACENRKADFKKRTPAGTLV